jgi:hypothetical protein
MVIIKECGLESKKEGKNKEKCVNRAMFLTGPPLSMVQSHNTVGR